MYSDLQDGWEVGHVQGQICRKVRHEDTNLERHGGDTAEWAANVSGEVVVPTMDPRLRWWFVGTRATTRQMLDVTSWLNRL